MLRSVRMRTLIVIVLQLSVPQLVDAAPKALSNGAAIASCAKVNAMGCVPGGSFIRGSDTRGKNSRPRATVELQTFYMDVHEVTVAEYDACVKAKKCKRAKTAYRDYNRAQQPKVGVSWYHARDFCKAMGKHLPTEAEWEKAARGSDGRLYPWGNKVATCKEAVIKDRRGRSCGVKKAKGKGPEKGRTFVVGTRKPNQFGLYDMAGNSWEWVNDWFTFSYEDCGAACLGVNPLGPCGGKDRCRGHRYKPVRGGSWYWPAAHATTVYRRPHVPSNKPYHHFGFRCAASASEVKAPGFRSSWL